MMRSMYSGVSGLRNHQTKMDVIGNNIANVNTPAYKKSRVVFKDVLYQNYRSATAPQGSSGGTNPMGIGLGVTIAGIDQIQTPAPASSTGKTTDMAIDGDGFFVLKTNGNDNVYTRNGAFTFDKNGNLVNANGYKVQGYVRNATTDNIKTGSDGQLTDVTLFKMNSDGSITNDLTVCAAKKTSTVTLSGNLNATQGVLDGPANADPNIAGNVDQWKNVVSFQRKLYNDSEGGTIPVNFAMGRDVNNHWVAYYFVYQYDQNNEIVLDPATGNPSYLQPITQITLDNGADLTFGTDGKYDLTTVTDPKRSSVDLTIPIPANADATGQEALTFKVDFSALNQYDGKSTATVESQDGYAKGSLIGLSVDRNGFINGVYDNEISKPLAQVAMGKCANPEGLIQAGGTLYRESTNSGIMKVNSPGEAGRGTIIPSSLEMSNVDLSEEFTDMIVTQRGFQANSRIITTSDEMLQELVNLKR